MTEAVSQSNRCPWCGGLVSEIVGSLGREGPTCPACGRRAIAQEHPFLGVYEAVEYDFDDVTPTERAAAADLLVEAGVPYRWDEGYRLQVPPEREEQVDVLFGHITPREPTDGDEQDNEPSELVADEESAQTLPNLFDAADRLRHHPDDDDAAAELADASGVVMIAPAPFGVNQVLWSTAGLLSRQLLDLFEARAARDDVIAAADALRAVLRDHV
jgi:hypothetical protein